VRYDTTLGDDNVTEELVQSEKKPSQNGLIIEKRGESDWLFVVSDGELEMTRDNTLLLVITSCVSSKLKNLGSEVLEDSGEVDWTSWRESAVGIRRKSSGRRTRSTGTDTLGVVALLEETVDTTDWELETSLGRAGLGLAVTAASLATGLARFAALARHDKLMK
jgi:hypothetical protein